MAVTRRSVIKGAVGSWLLAGSVPVRAEAEQLVPQGAPRDYVRVSSALLGVAPDVMEPPQRPGTPPLADVFHARCSAAAAARLPPLRSACARPGNGRAPTALARWRG